MKRKEEKQFYNTSAASVATIPFAKPHEPPARAGAGGPFPPHPSALSRDPPPAALFRPGRGGPTPHRHAPPFPHPPQFRPQAGFPHPPPPHLRPPPGGGPFRGPPGGPPHGHMPPPGSRGGPPPQRQPPHHQPTPQKATPKKKPAGDGDEEIIEEEYVDIDDDFIERPRRPRPPPASKTDGAGKGEGRKGEDDDWPQQRYKPHERTALLGRRAGDKEDRERHRNTVIKVIYLILFALAALEVILITAFSGWVIHMVSCIAYGSCSPSGERLASFGLYFVILFVVFILPYIVGALGVATSSGRILWFFSFITALIDVVIIVLLCVYVRWEVALAMIPQLVVALFGFGMSSVLSSEDAERGPDAMHNRCCLFLCC